MKVTVDNVIDKLAEYGLGLITDYATEDKGHCFIIKNMIVFLDEKDDSLSITFQADCKPEESAQMTLMLAEIKHINDISIMESFIYDKDNKFITGKQAHNLIHDSITIKAVRKLAKEHAYMELLNNTECFDC